MEIFKEKYCKFNAIILLFSVSLYLLNQSVIKNVFTSVLFFHCYFNDLLAPVVVLSFSNLLLVIKRQRTITSFKQITGLCMFCAVCWEWLAIYIKPDSTFDLWDIVAYFIGASLYKGVLWAYERKVRQ